MLKLLIIEDEHEKRRLITETLLEVSGVFENDIDYASDVLASKRMIAAIRYDMIVLDINIPARPALPTKVGAGLDVLTFIKINERAKPPGFLVGMTAYEDGFAASIDSFSSPLWKLMKFSYSDLSWQKPLKEALEYVVSIHKPPYATDGHTYHTDLAIVVALEDEELDSIRNLNASWVEKKIPFDHSRYFEGSFASSRGRLSVVAVAAPKMGLPASAVIASKLINAYRPRFLAMTGICAGVRGKANIGDILVADPCFDWGSGKWIRERDSGELRFRPAPYPWRLDEKIRSAIKAFGESKETLSLIHQGYTGTKPEKPPMVMIDAMASGGSVLQVAQLMDDVRDQHKNLVGVEMESYSIFTAAEYASDPRPQCFSIKAVCDFGDEQKSDSSHAYAAHVSAEFLYRFSIENLLPDPD